MSRVHRSLMTRLQVDFEHVRGYERERSCIDPWNAESEPVQDNFRRSGASTRLRPSIGNKRLLGMMDFLLRRRLKENSLSLSLFLSLHPSLDLWPRKFILRCSRVVFIFTLIRSSLLVFLCLWRNKRRAAFSSHIHALRAKNSRSSRLVRFTIFPHENFIEL